jgi:hypothetical protein
MRISWDGMACVRLYMDMYTINNIHNIRASFIEFNFFLW